jgi:multidrug efflux pump subunit AcrB
VDAAAGRGLSDAIAYVGEGGPRFILGLTSPDPAPHRAYVVANLDPGADRDAVLARLSRELPEAFPALRAEPKPFSLGETEAGLAVLHVSAERPEDARRAADAVIAAFRAVPGARDVRDDGESAVWRLAVDLDAAAARRAGVSLGDVVDALRASTQGEPISVIREGDADLALEWRARAPYRAADRLGDTLVPTADGAAPLSELAALRLTAEPAVIHRRDKRFALTVTARHPTMTASALVEAAAPALAAADLPPGVAIAPGGEIEENEVVTDAVFSFLPFCLALIVVLFVAQLNSMRKVAIIIASIPFCAAGVILALAAAGQPFDFMANLGLLALIGMIVSNAILVMEQIEEDEAAGAPLAEAIRDACVKRLRPIVTTQATTVLGLLPLLLSGDPLWISFNIVVMGGLAAGSVASLVIAPALYALLFHPKPGARLAPRERLATP